MLGEGVEAGRIHSPSSNYGNLYSSSGNFGNIATALSVGSLRKPWVNASHLTKWGQQGRSETASQYR